MSRAMILVLVALLIACGEGFTAPDRSGSMSFTYHGALVDSPSGAFSVQGGRNSWPAGAGGEVFGSGTRIIGSLGQGAPEFSVTLIGPMAVGSLPTCEYSNTPPTPCVGGGYYSQIHQFYYGFGPSGQPPYPEMHVTITDLTASRVRGTFEGIALGICSQCRPALDDTVTISGGVFDVPYR